jgi:hypothetical protein
MASSDLGAPVAVSDEQEARESRVAHAPTGGFTAVWSNRPAGSRRPLAQIQTVVESSSRP